MAYRDLREFVQKLKERRVDFSRSLLLQPVASVRDQLDVAKVSELLACHFRYWHRADAARAQDNVHFEG